MLLWLAYTNAFSNTFTYIAYRGFHEKGTLPTCVPMDRLIVPFERVYTPSTFYMKSAVSNY